MEAVIDQLPPLEPAEFWPLFDREDFKILPYEQRKEKVSQAVSGVYKYLKDQPDFNDELSGQFGQFASNAYAKLDEGHTTGERIGEGGKFLLGVGKSLLGDAAVVGTALEEGLNPMSDKPTAKALVKGFGLGATRTVDSYNQWVDAGVSDSHDNLKAALSNVKQQIDSGTAPVSDPEKFIEWLKNESTKTLTPQKEWTDFRLQDYGMTDPGALATANQLAAPQNAGLLAAYISSRSPEVWTQLEKSIAATPLKAALGEEAQSILQSEIGQKLDRTLGSGASEHILSASDPLNVLAWVLPAVKAAALGKAVAAAEGGFASRMGTAALSTAKTLPEQAALGAAMTLGHDPEATSAEVATGAAQMAGVGVAMHGVGVLAGEGARALKAARGAPEGDNGPYAPAEPPIPPAEQAVVDSIPDPETKANVQAVVEGAAAFEGKPLAPEGEQVPPAPVDQGTSATGGETGSSAPPVSTSEPVPSISENATTPSSPEGTPPAQPTAEGVPVQAPAEPVVEGSPPELRDSEAVVQPTGTDVAAERVGGSGATSNKESVVNAERLAKGLDPVAKEDAIANADSLERGQAAVAKNPTLPDEIVSRLREASPEARTISLDDSSALVVHRVNLQTERDAAADRAADESLDAPARAAASTRWAELEGKISDLDQAAQDARSVWGRFGQFWQQMVKKDFSFEALDRKERISRPEGLTDEQIRERTAKVKSQAEQHAELTRIVEEKQKVVDENNKLRFTIEQGQHHTAKLEALLKAAGKPITRAAPKVVDPVHVPAPNLSQKIAAFLDAEGAKARIRAMERAKQREGGLHSGGLDPADLVDEAIYGASLLSKKIKFSEWSAKMVELGAYVKDHLPALWKMAKARFAELVKSAPRDIDAERTSTIAGIKARLAEGDTPADLHRYAEKLARQFIDQGITELEPLSAAVHGALKEAIPDITATEARDAWTGFGKWTPLDKAPEKVIFRQRRAEGQAVSKIELYEKGQPAPKTGREQEPQTEAKRALEAKAAKLAKENERKAAALAKELGIEVPPKSTAQLKSSLDAVKTRLRNEIGDMDFALATSERMVKDKTGVEYDTEAKALKAARDAKKALYDEVFPKEELTSGEQEAQQQAALRRAGEALDARLKGEEKALAAKEGPDSQAVAALKEQNAALRSQLAERRTVASLEKAIAEIDRKLSEGDLGTKGAPTRVESVRVEQLKAERNAMNILLAEERRAAKPKKTDAEIQAGRLARAESVATRNLEEWNKTLAEARKGIFPKREGPELGPNPERLQRIKDAAKAAKAQVDELRMLANPKRSATEVELAARLTRALNRIVELDRRRAAKDFTPPKKEPVMGPRTLKETKAQAELDKALVDKKKAENAFNADRERDRLEKRQGFEKAFDAATGWNRAFKLSRVGTLVKLALYSIFKLGSTPIYEGVGAVYSRLPGYARLANRASLEGHASGPALRAFYRGFFGQGMRDAAANLSPVIHMVTRGKYGDAGGISALKALHGKPDSAYGPASGGGHHIYDIPQILHEVEKSPLRRAAFEMAAEKLFKQAKEKGLDITEAGTRADLLKQAYEQSDRAILMSDNAWANLINRGIRSLEEPSKATGKVTFQGKLGATVLRAIATFNKVGSNHFVEAIVNGTLGFPIGQVRFGIAVLRGLENLHPEEANSILRQLKQGTPGAAMLAFGMLAPQMFGGLDPRKKRKEGEPGFGEMMIGGHRIPRTVTMAFPPAIAAQLGATITQVAQSRKRQTNPETQGIGSGVLAATASAAETGPLVNEGARIGKLFNPNEREQFIYDFLRSNFEPGLLSELADALDKDEEGRTVRRKPTNLKEQLELGIPVLRESVPERKK